MFKFRHKIVEYVSEFDRFIQSIRKPRTASQRAEFAKHQRVFKLRDMPEE